MKTPEEIKRAMKGCAKDDCRECAYYKNRATCMEEMMVDALAYIRQLEAERMQPTKWISAETPPPETKDEDGYAVNYLIYDPEDGVDIGSYIPEIKTWFCVGMPCNVTHWMSLPYEPGEYEKMMKQLEEAEKMPGVTIYAHGDKIEIKSEEEHAEDD